MQNVSQNEQGSRRRIAPPARRSARHAPRTAQRHLAPHVLTLGQSSVLSLPSLAGVATDYTFSQDTAGIVSLAQHLIRADFGTERMWEKSKHNLLTFVQDAFDSLLDSAGGAQCSNHMEICLNISNQPLAQNTKDFSSVIAMELEVGNCGFLCLGSAINQLEDEAPGLGAAFYSVLLSCLCRYCSCFDYATAEYSRESQVEMACEELRVELDDLPANVGDTYQFYEPTRSVPARILTAVQNPSHKRNAQSLQLLRLHRAGEHAEWIELLLTLQVVAARYQKATGDELEDNCLPSFVVAFADQDDIVAAFDEYAATAFEGDQATVYMKRFDASSPAAMKTAITSLNLITRLYSITCQIAELTNPKDATE